MFAQSAGEIDDPQGALWRRRSRLDLDGAGPLVQNIVPVDAEASGPAGIGARHGTARGGRGI